MTKGYEYFPSSNIWVKTRYTGAKTIVGMKTEGNLLKIIRNIHTKSGFRLSSFVFSSENMEIEEICAAL